MTSIARQRDQNFILRTKAPKSNHGFHTAPLLYRLLPLVFQNFTCVYTLYDIRPIVTIVISLEF